MASARILLIACYELGHPPLSAAWPLAFLRRAGLDAQVLDLSVAGLPAELPAPDLVLIAAPMHTALRLGVQAAAQIRARHAGAHICFFGLYAHLNAGLLFQAGAADSAAAGEAEPTLVALAQALAAGRPLSEVAGLTLPQRPAPPRRERTAFPVPDRSQLAPLSTYARLSRDGALLPAGYTEATRGCRHTCRHCPLTPIYQGRFFAVPAEVVLADIAQQADAGAKHITFGDPDFLNAPTHALRLARELHARWPGLSFDFTAKVEHILQHRALMPEFARLGGAFVVSAVESLSDEVLRRLGKGHTAADVEAVVTILDEAGLALHPTLVAFTPWTTLADYLEQLEFIQARGLQRHIPPVQLSIRLLIPPGSPLAEAPDAAAWLGPIDAENFTHRWTHPDPRLDHLQAQVAALAAAAEAEGQDEAETFAAIRALAWASAGQTPPALPSRPIRPAPPRLTEDWFC